MFNTIISVRRILLVMIEGAKADIRSDDSVFNISFKIHTADTMNFAVGVYESGQCSAEDIV